MKRQTIGNSMIATVLGIGLLTGCSINQVHAGTAKTPGMTGTMMSASPAHGMGGPGSIPASGSPEKSYGVLTFEGSNDSRVREIIGAEGGSFSNTNNIPYYAGTKYVHFENNSYCMGQVGYLTVGKMGTVRFSRNNRILHARISIRTLSAGKIVPLHGFPMTKAVKTQNQCGNDRPYKPENVSERILTETIPVTPGKALRIRVGNSIVTISLDKDFPVAQTPAWPAFTNPEKGIGGNGYGMGLMGGMGG